ncbi:MAG: polysaccharide biosynthesis/export family protein, partial [Cyclobacteriaceae bacterium]
MIRHIFLFLTVLFLLSSCKSYKQDILFQYDEKFTEADLTQATEEVESNYILQPNDILLLDVFTNKGERLIDPNFELIQQANAQAQQQRDLFQFVIQADGSVVFPLIGKCQVDGLTLNEAELKVAELFGDVYKDPFVKLRISNR